MTKENFFSIKGRLSRMDYFIRAILLGIPSAILDFISDNTSEPIVLIFSGLFMLLAAVFIAIQMVKRLHDIDMSGWYWFVLLIPIVNIIFGLYIVFKDGTVGANQYGVDPKGR